MTTRLSTPSFTALACRVVVSVKVRAPVYWFQVSPLSVLYMMMAPSSLLVISTVMLSVKVASSGRVGFSTISIVPTSVALMM